VNEDPQKTRVEDRVGINAATTGRERRKAKERNVTYFFPQLLQIGISLWDCDSPHHSP